MVTNKEKLEIYIGMLENILEAQSPDSEKLQELSFEMMYALDLRDYSDEELEKDLWFQERVSGTCEKGTRITGKGILT